MTDETFAWNFTSPQLPSRETAVICWAQWSRLTPSMGTGVSWRAAVLLPLIKFEREKKEKENAGAHHQDRFIKLKLVDSRVVPGCPAAAHHAGRWRERCCWNGAWNTPANQRNTGQDRARQLLFGIFLIKKAGEKAESKGKATKCRGGWWCKY